MHPVTSNSNLNVCLVVFLIVFVWLTYWGTYLTFSLLNLKKDYLFYVYECIACMHLCAPHAYLVPTEFVRECPTTENWVMGVQSHHEDARN